jgi:hypothetical protein
VLADENQGVPINLHEVKATPQTRLLVSVNQAVGHPSKHHEPSHWTIEFHRPVTGAVSLRHDRGRCPGTRRVWPNTRDSGHQNLPAGGHQVRAVAVGR